MFPCRLLAPFLVALFSLHCLPIVAQQTPLAVWPLNMAFGAQDTSGNGNHGSMSSSLTFGPGPDGRAGGSMVFDGEPDDIILVQNGPFGPLDFNRSFTLSGYFKPIGIMENFTPFLMYSDANGNYGSSVWYLESGYTIQFQMVTFVNHICALGTVNDIFSPGDWTFFVASYDFDNGVRRFCSDSTCHEHIVSSGCTVEHRTHKPVYLGGQPGIHFTNKRLHGQLSCMVLYDSYLDLGEISALQNSSLDCSIGVQSLPCENTNCANGGTCHPIPETLGGGETCCCPRNYTGPTCEEVVPRGGDCRTVVYNDRNIAFLPDQRNCQCYFFCKRWWRAGRRIHKRRRVCCRQSRVWCPDRGRCMNKDVCHSEVCQDPCPAGM